MSPRGSSRLGSRFNPALRTKVRHVFEKDLRVYGAREVWRQMMREGSAVARCTVERLMSDIGLVDIVRGKPVRTTFSDKSASHPLDRVSLQLRAPAPNMP